MLPVILLLLLGLGFLFYKTSQGILNSCHGELAPEKLPGEKLFQRLVSSRQTHQKKKKKGFAREHYGNFEEKNIVMQSINSLLPLGHIWMPTACYHLQITGFYYNTMITCDSKYETLINRQSIINTMDK